MQRFPQGGGALPKSATVTPRKHPRRVAALLHKTGVGNPHHPGGQGS
jgi:hypothetical protein